MSKSLSPSSKEHRAGRQYNQHPSSANSNSSRISLGNIASCVLAQVPRTDIRQLALLRQHRGVGAYVGDVGAKRAKVRVAIDPRDAVEEGGGLVVEVLSRFEALVWVAIFGDPSGGDVLHPSLANARWKLAGPATFSPCTSHSLSPDDLRVPRNFRSNAPEGNLPCTLHCTK